MLVGVDSEEYLSEVIIKQGYLMKKGGGESLFGRKNWKVRYFVLWRTHLCYYKTEQAALEHRKVKDYKRHKRTRSTSAVAAPLGVIKLRDVQSVHTLQEGTSRSDTHFCFTLETPYRTFYLCNKDFLIYNEWFGEVKKLVFELQNENTIQLSRLSILNRSCENIFSNFENSPKIPRTHRGAASPPITRRETITNNLNSGGFAYSPPGTRSSRGSRGSVSLTLLPLPPINKQPQTLPAIGGLSQPQPQRFNSLGSEILASNKMPPSLKDRDSTETKQATSKPTPIATNPKPVMRPGSFSPPTVRKAIHSVMATTTTSSSSTTTTTPILGFSLLSASSFEALEGVEL